MLLRRETIYGARGTTRALFQLQRWYVAQCDGEWEHDFGVEITTVDNPGWRVRIDLAHTALSGLAVDLSKVERSEHDWIHWWVAEERYEAACGPTNLNEAILTFLDLAGA